MKYNDLTDVWNRMKYSYNINNEKGIKLLAELGCSAEFYMRLYNDDTVLACFDKDSYLYSEIATKIMFGNRGDI